MKCTSLSVTAIAALLATVLVMAENSIQPVLEKHDLAGVKNYTRMEAAGSFAGSLVGFGGATDPSAMAGLVKEGFASVINLRLADEEGVDIAATRQAADAVGIRYIHLPVDPGNLAPGSVDLVLEAMGEESNQPVFLHCSSASRAGAVWMIARVLEDGWSVDAASAEAELIAEKPDEALAFATAFIAARRAVDQ